MRQLTTALKENGMAGYGAVDELLRQIGVIFRGPARAAISSPVMSISSVRQRVRIRLPF